MDKKQILILYISRAKKLHEKGEVKIYRNMKRLASLSRLITLKEIVKKRHPSQIPNFINRYKQDLLNVLPHPGDWNYSLTKNELNELLNSES